MNNPELTHEEKDHIIQVAKNFKAAFKGLGTDEDAVIKELTACKNSQRQLIKKAYLTLYGKTLEEDLRSELSGNFKDLALALLMPAAEYEAFHLYHAMKGLGTNERMLIEILCTKDANEIQEIRDTYTRVYKRDLDEHIKSEQGGDLGRILRSIASGGRASNHGFDQNLVKQEAQALYDAGEGKTGTDELEIIRIICSKSFGELRAIFHVYKDIAKHDFEVAIRREFSGDVLLACVTIFRSVVNRPLYYAMNLHDTCAGLGTKDQKLIRLLVSRSEIDLAQIKAAYFNFYKKTLYALVKADTSGDYQKLLLAIIGT